jgi:glycine cleavage system H protein
VTPLGAKLQSGDELASIETIKVNLSLASPVSGTIVEVNPVLSNAPETFNQDPYGTGWLVVIEATNWDAERTALLDPTAYFAYMKADVDREAKKE